MQYLNRRTLIVMTLLLVVCSACGPSIIRGQPPFISISSLNLDDQKMTAVFTVSNQNGELMEINGVEIRVQLDNTELTRYNENYNLTIGANSTEDVTVEQLPDASTQKLLTALENGELISLPFDLEGRVNTVADGYLKFRNKGHLYPVPGRPGQFRSATTHSNRIDGEDPFKKIENRN
jgi:LEA14-like dessication related protein